MKLNYQEGDVFVVPFGGGGHALGVIARSNGRGGLLAYCFESTFEGVPASLDCEALEPELAIARVICGDLHLLKGKWSIIGRIPDWNPLDWPLPSFVRRDRLSGATSLVTYDDRTLQAVDVRPCDPSLASTLPQDGSLGAVALERTLARLLGKSRHN